MLRRGYVVGRSVVLLAGLKPFIVYGGSRYPLFPQCQRLETGVCKLAGPCVILVWLGLDVEAALVRASALRSLTAVETNASVKKLCSYSGLVDEHGTVEEMNLSR